MSFLSRDGRQALGSMAAMGCATMIALASALFILALPFFMWFAFGDTGSPGLWWLVWLLAILFVIFFNITRAIEVSRDQNPKDLMLMLLATSLIILGCPLTLEALTS